MVSRRFLRSDGSEIVDVEVLIAGITVLVVVVDCM
jgi:hypothetical protein